ncbi:MAG: hypothetical protein EOO38_30340 [Cytophagaceae bacterium]|nr:MAG: hypothetical protein EOO38_30340 [Cytophagaceae bacterium]
MHEFTNAQLDRIISMLTEFSQSNSGVGEIKTGDEQLLNKVIAELYRLGHELENDKKEVLQQRAFVNNVLSKSSVEWRLVQVCIKFVYKYGVTRAPSLRHVRVRLCSVLVVRAFSFWR